MGVEIKNNLLAEKIDELNQKISELKNTIIKNEDEYDTYKRKFTDLEFSVNILKEQNETLEKNEIDLNETIDLLKQNNKNQLNKHNVELSNKIEEIELKTNEQIDKSKLNDKEILVHSLKEKNGIFEIKNNLLIKKLMY